MATAGTAIDSGLISFLLRQLVQSWYLDIETFLARRIVSKFLLFQKAPKERTPPLVSFLMSLADAPVTEHESAAKKLPCCHTVDVSAILTCSNLFSDRVWGQGTNFLQCSQCDANYALPMIPNPWVVDGLQTRLDIVQWAWTHSKDAPTNADVNLGKVLRYILDQMGHLPRDLEITSSLPWTGPSQRRQRETLRLLEAEAVELADGKLYTGPILLRGRGPYCKFRPSKALQIRHLQLKYYPPSPGQNCSCAEPHECVRDPRAWASTPAEDEEKWEFAVSRIENSGNTIRRNRASPFSIGGNMLPWRGRRRKTQKKTVRFAAPVITDIHYFEPWWRKEYRDSDRYYSSGPCRTSVDRSTRLDDDRAEALAVEGSKSKTL